MKTLVNMQITKSRLLLIPLLMLAMLTGTASMRAQKTSFTMTDKDITGEFANMSNIARFSSWTFDNCWGIKENIDNGMQVGSDKAPGKAMSPALGTYGNISLVVNAQNINGVTSETDFILSVEDGDAIIYSGHHSVKGKDAAHPSAITISGCTPTSRVCITSNNQKFLVKDVHIYPINSAVFYESFDFLSAANTWGNGTVASSDMCDNNGSTTMNGCYQSKENLYITSNNSNYIIAKFASNSSDFLMTFKAGHYNAGGSYNIEVTCTSASLSDFDSYTSSDVSTSRNLQLGSDNNNWESHFIVIRSASSSSKLTFTGDKVKIDDILITPIPATLDEHADNSTYIKANAGQTIDVQLSRTLTGGVWCPLCLPFDVTPEVMTVAIGSCEVETLQSIDAGVFKFAALPSGQTIDAGTPFIVRPATTKVNPSFSEVTVKDAEPQTVTAGNTEGYALRGIFSPTELTNDGTNLFLGSNGSLLTLSSEATDRRLSGLRAFFVVPQGTSSARMTTGNAQTGISPATTTSAGAATATYDLTGCRTGGNSRTIIVKQGKKIVGQRNIYK